MNSNQYVQPDLTGLKQIVYQSTGIPLGEIVDDTEFVSADLGDRTDEVLRTCSARFGKSPEGGPQNFGQLRKQYGV
jgi:hypothetical protein